MSTKRIKLIPDGLLILLVITSLILAIFRMYVDRETISPINTSEIANYETAIKDLKDRINILSDYSCFYKLPDSLQITNIDGVNKLVKEVVTSNTLVLYIDSYFCTSCNKNWITELKEVKKKGLDDIDFLILAGNYSAKEIKAYNMYNKINIPTYLLDIDNSDYFKKIRTAGNPFYFLLSSELEVSNLFFPSATTRSYLNNRYFDNLSKISLRKLNHYYSNNSNIKVINPKIDLGDMKLKNKYSVVFKIINNGDQPCIFESLKSSCSCVIPVADLTPLPPGSIRKIQVDVFPQEKGPFEKEIALKIKSSKNPFQFMSISGNVK